MFIVVEGGDGCGKTTLCALLAEELGAVAYATPPKEYAQQRELIDRNATADEHYRFYREAIYAGSKEIDQLLKGGECVICDRYWLSTYTWHQVMGVNVLREDFSSIVEPDLTVILTVNHEMQVARIQGKDMSTNDRRTFSQQEEAVMAFYRNALEFHIPFLMIDTQRFSPTTCVKITRAAFEL